MLLGYQSCMASALRFLSWPQWVQSGFNVHLIPGLSVKAAKNRGNHCSGWGGGLAADTSLPNLEWDQARSKECVNQLRNNNDFFGFYSPGLDSDCWPRKERLHTSHYQSFEPLKTSPSSSDLLSFTAVLLFFMGM